MTLGIDLGTTRSAVSVVEAGDPVLIRNMAGDPLTPSVVSFEEDKVRVGKEATDALKRDDGRTIKHTKRHMGEDHTWTIDDEEYTPSDVSAEILKKLKFIADEKDYDTDEAIITVPAYFTVDQKKDTKKAAKQAGFKDVDLLHEPTAAAIAYGQEKDLSGKLFVFDYGGGTLDISIIEVDGDVFHTLAVGGDTELGGVDFTEALMNYLADEKQEKDGIDLRESQEARETLRALAEQAKITLSGRNDEVEIDKRLICMMDGKPVGIEKVAVDQATFEDITEELVDSTIDPINETLELADLDADDIDDVLLVGGSSKIPAVQTRIEDLFGFEPTKTNDLDRLVAQGAAIVADQDGSSPDGDYVCPKCNDVFDIYDDYEKHVKEHDEEDDTEPDVYNCHEDDCPKTFDSEADRNAHMMEEHNEVGKVEWDGIVGRSLGTDVEDGMDILIDGRETLPAKKQSTYIPTSENPDKIPVHVYQGEDTDNRSNNEKLRDWYVQAPSTDEDQPRIKVTFDIDEDSVLHVSAEHADTGEELGTTQVDTTGGDIDEEDFSTEKAGADD